MNSARRSASSCPPIHQDPRYHYVRDFHFRILRDLPEAVLSAVRQAGYESPTPIQAATIPHVLEGRDVIAQAQTGTGKTAAFALPLLARIDIGDARPQVLVLTPTRELALQVAEAFQTYAANLPELHVLPIYGGQEYGRQLRALRRGVHVVVGTPGRIMDHMRRGTLDLSALHTLVLDEADEMLRMGFVDDVDWILEKTPAERQVALFSATMPAPIRRIAQRHLRDPEEIKIQVKVTTADTVRQRYCLLRPHAKLDALTRILEAEDFEAVILFVRTKTATVELAEKLAARGYAVAPLNGDIPQNQRQRTVEQLKSGWLDIIVATDVAARGLDVQRITHVINYDVPLDTESYVHRIGRTGRAGRSGDAILFVTPREKRLLLAIERATRKKIEPMELPTAETINSQRLAKFQQRISDTLANQDVGFFRELLQQYEQEHNVPALDIAAALATLLQGDEPLLLDEKALRAEPNRERRPANGERMTLRRRSRREAVEMASYRIEVGRNHGVRPGNIMGAIANEAGLDSRFIGRINIHDDFSTVDLPDGMPREVLRTLKKVWVAGRPLNISKA
ncbi:ATP-dependent RNA helicase DeaD [Methylomarinovum caldicuralii]|uniref:ATP-dependent RNA helicase DeaD n=1 Tax=Methylomarinovum caldicuralii TaxID=438856 RepID=A0AAU9CQY9_9GAMM|nr:DEAD/DEAH box helicase [Methylomarinovum caldicuralii]BCX81942.1 ATP-dependent RNA helicase DeaD [Methylomarinovum caldicuralii]